ncbi:hypothetical protein BC828DRAFT_380657 [Blastocladiella britannica]|nr:hypothetical protein BC828DRAFT_380657 [Blastocladiella britannica]
MSRRSHPSLESLQAFCARPEAERTWDADFEPVLHHTATTGALCVAWPILRELAKARILHIITALNAEAESAGSAPDAAAVNAHLRVIGAHMDALVQSPFTVQRLCEIVLVPPHTDVLKLLRAVDKVVAVSQVEVPSEVDTDGPGGGGMDGDELLERALVAFTHHLTDDNNNNAQDDDDDDDDQDRTITLRRSGSGGDGMEGIESSAATTAPWATP